MRKLKITMYIEADAYRDAHEALDAADAALRQRGGRAMRANIREERHARPAVRS